MTPVLFRAAAGSRLFCGKCKADQKLNLRLPPSALFAEEWFLQSQGLLFFALTICASSSLPISSDFARRPMTPPSPLFPCTCLGYLPARPTRNSVPQANASPPPPSPCPSARHPQRSEGSLFSDPPIPQLRSEGARPFTHSACSTKWGFQSLPFRYNISYHDIFPEPGPLVLLFIYPAGPTREITVSQEDTHDSATPPVRPLASCCRLRLGSLCRRLQQEAYRHENPFVHSATRFGKAYGHA